MIYSLCLLLILVGLYGVVVSRQTIKIVISLLIVPFTAFVALFFFFALMAVVSFVYRVITLATGSATWGMRLMAIELRDAQRGAAGSWQGLSAHARLHRQLGGRAVATDFDRSDGDLQPRSGADGYGDGHSRPQSQGKGLTRTRYTCLAAQHWYHLANHSGNPCVTPFLLPRSFM